MYNFQISASPMQRDPFEQFAHEHFSPVYSSAVVPVVRIEPRTKGRTFVNRVTSDPSRSVGQGRTFVNRVTSDPSRYVDQGRTFVMRATSAP